MNAHDPKSLAVVKAVLRETEHVQNVTIRAARILDALDKLEKGKNG